MLSLNLREANSLLLESAVRVPPKLQDLEVSVETTIVPPTTATEQVASQPQRLCVRTELGSMSIQVHVCILVLLCGADPHAMGTIGESPLLCGARSRLCTSNEV